jgi:cysteine-rich repeat protein
VADTGEECDAGGDTSTCDADCTTPACGDGHHNPLAGEDCEDGNVLHGDGCSAWCVVEPFGPPAPGEPGGQNVFDSAGNHYYLSYSGGLHRVPPGGGPIVSLVTPAAAGNNGFGGAVHVQDDDTVLFQGGSRVIRYVPSTGELQTYATIPFDNYGMGTIVDANENVLAMRVRRVIHPDGTQDEIPWVTDYVITTADWIYLLQGNQVLRTRFDGSETTTWGTGLSDSYGLAIGASGELYVGQGNTTPSTLFRIPPGGGAATVFASIPVPVLSVTTDAAGMVYVAGYGGSHHDALFLVDPATGDVTVYGCDAGSPAGCP